MRLVPALLGSLLALATAGAATALEPRLDVGGFREEDRAVAEEIAGYSVDERHAALVAAGHPEDLLEIQQIQRASADDFAALVEGLAREDQEQIWDLVRYPGLVADLARGGPRTDAELDRIAERHPEEIRAAIRSEGRERYDTWVEIYALDLEAEQVFSNVTARQPAEVRDAFERLRGRPELMSLLVDNIAATTRIGSAYREDPTRVEARFDALHQDVLARRSDQEKTWAREIEDPEAREELRQAAHDFAEEHGYPLEDALQDPPAVRTQVVYVDRYVDVHPYPYWFGYPSWYAHPCWYPTSLWGHIGFRYGSGSTYIGVGLPSPYFLGWYDRYYYGPYGFAGYYGYPGHYGVHRYSGYRPGYGDWNHHGRHGGRSHGDGRHFRSARYYDDHRPRYATGQHPRSDRFVGRRGDRVRADDHARGDQQVAPERPMKRPHQRWQSRSHEDGRPDAGPDSPSVGPRPRDGGGSAPGRDGGARGPDRPGLERRRRGDPGDRSGSGSEGRFEQRRRPGGRGGSASEWTSDETGSARIERGDDAWPGRERASRPRPRDVRPASGGRSRPDVSSGPPAGFARRERAERGDRSGFRLDRPSRSAPGSARESTSMVPDGGRRGVSQGRGESMRSRRGDAAGGGGAGQRLGRAHSGGGRAGAGAPGGFGGPGDPGGPSGRQR